MSNQIENGLWRATDDNSQRLFTTVFNPLIKDIISGKLTATEIRVLLFFCRMSFGFHREETNYLGYEDIEAETGIAKSHLSLTIKQLIDKGFIFWGAESARKRKYCINFFRYGCTMKYYRLSKNCSDLRDGEEVFGSVSYEFGKERTASEVAVIYNRKGYEKNSRSYRKEDIKNEIKRDTCSFSAQKYFPQQEFETWDRFRVEYTQKPCIETIFKFIIKLKQEQPNYDFANFETMCPDKIGIEKNTKKETRFLLERKLAVSLARTKKII